MKKVACLFGSFNPVHIGHLKMMEWLLEQNEFDEVRVVLSNNPSKVNRPDMASFDKRFDMLTIGLKSMGLDKKGVKVSDVEKDRYPSYTYDTLKILSEIESDKIFNIVIGDDLVDKIKIWRNNKKLLAEFNVYVLSRLSEHNNDKHGGLTFLNSPIFEASSTEVRNLIKENKTISKLVPKELETYILNNKIY